MAKVSTYRLLTGSGRKIRKATKVEIEGRVVRFMDKLGKREAVKQAKARIKEHPEYFPKRR